MTAAAPESAAALRPMRWWDIEAVLPLERELFAADPWSAESFWAELAGQADPGDRWYLVAESSGGAIVGYAGLACPAPARGGDAEVMTVAVSPAVQGSGLGRRLLAALLDEARQRGASRVMLEVRADNVAAQSLYRTTGFEQVAVRSAYYKPAPASGPDAPLVDALVLALRLDG